MDFKNERKKFELSSKNLRKARRRYMWLCREYIIREGNIAIDHCQRKMQKRGLYLAKSSPRCIRQSIQSHLFRIEKYLGFGGGWHEWCMYRGMRAYTGYCYKIKRRRYLA